MEAGVCGHGSNGNEALRHFKLAEGRVAARGSRGLLSALIVACAAAGAGGEEIVQDRGLIVSPIGPRKVHLSRRDHTAVAERQTPWPTAWLADGQRLRFHGGVMK